MRGERAALVRIVRAAAPRRGGTLAPALAAGVGAAACGVGLLATSGGLITRAAERPPVLALAVAIGAVQAFSLGRGLGRYAERLAVHAAALALLERLRLWLFDVVEPLVPGGLGVPGTGEVLAGFVADAEAVADGLARLVLGALEVAASVGLGAAVLAFLDPPAVPILLGGAALALLGAAASAAAARRAASREAAARAALAELTVELAGVAPELLLYDRTDLLAERLGALEAETRRAALRRARAAGWGRATVTLAAGATLVGVLLPAIAAVGAGTLTGVHLAVVVFAALAVVEACGSAPAALAAAQGAAAAAERLEALAGRPAPVSEPARDAAPGPGTPTLALDGVVRAGAAGEPALTSAVSVTVGPGRRVVVRGPSGAGKTTLLHLALHFLEPTQGAVRLGGRPVREMTRAGLARRLAWMADETHVFAASLGDNLRLARPEASEDECLAVLGRVGLGALVASLPDGLATRLGSGGRSLSAGERQRLGLARALLGNAGVLLLDEPTAHVDPQGAPALLAELLAAADDRGVLLVTHEGAAAIAADAVVELSGPERGDLRRSGGVVLP